MAVDTFESFREATHVEEAEELDSLVAQVTSGGPEQAAAVYPRFRKILEKYQENSQLLDPHLPNIVAPLAESLQRAALLGPSTGQHTGDVSQHVHQISCLLWVVASVRGNKVVVKFFPHSAADLEPVAILLKRLDAQAGEVPGGHWEAQCVVLLWLSQLVLLPFKLALLDSSLADTDQDQRLPYPPLVGRLVELCKRHLSLPGSSREMAALLLGKLLTRPDTQAALLEFLQWAVAALGKTGREAVFLVPGVTHAIAAILRSGQREVLLPILPTIWGKAVSLLDSDAAASSVLTRKLAVKLFQRMGLVLLPPKDASWRYLHSLSMVSDSLAVNPPAKGAPAAADGCLVEPSGQEFDDTEALEELEEVIELLLRGLRDSATVVRWSAAKGLGRVTARLSKDLGDEVVEQVLELFKEVHSDTAWHGACLTLAELARRGLLLPHRLGTISPLIATALQLDIRRGAHSVGAHVRDAAAYVCWAFARAYPANVMASTVATLAPALLTVACYDREVNCRRAAAAAFQESVGRQGSFPKGIEVVTAADYFSLGTISQAYLVIAPYVAGIPEYGPMMRQHLLAAKLRYWERSLRELAATAVATLVPTDSVFFTTSAIDFLLPLCTDPSLETRHGAVMGLAELLLACYRHQCPISHARLAEIAIVPSRIAEGRLFRGKGGELIRAAVCRLIECCAAAELPLTTEQAGEYRTVLDDNLRHPSQAIQAQAVAAFAAFCRQHLTTGVHPGEVAEGYLSGLKDPSPSIRRGCASALGALPLQLLGPSCQAVLHGLAEATKACPTALPLQGLLQRICLDQVEDQPELRDAESRVHAVKALAAVASRLLSVSRRQPHEEQGHISAVPQHAPGTAASQAAIAATATAPVPPPVGVGALPQHAPGTVATAPVPPPVGVVVVAQHAPGTAANQTATAATATAPVPPPVDLGTVVGSGGQRFGREPAAHPEQPGDESAMKNGCMDPRQMMRDVRECVAGALLQAAEDYSIDTRGDVGSWVREAAMEALVMLLGALFQRPDCHDNQDFCRSLALSAVGIMLQQSVERISRVRETAVSQLQALLTAVPATLELPERDSLAEVSRAPAARSASSMEGLHKVARLLSGTAYRAGILQGLVFSIGGIDGSLAEAAGAALLESCRTEASLSEICDAFMDLWRHNQRSSRLATPFLKTADVLLGLAVPDGMHPCVSQHAEGLLELVKAEMRGCKDVARLCAAATVLCQLFGAMQPVREKALACLAALLVSRLPKVRKFTAEQLYLQLLGQDVNEDLEAASDILLSTSWDNSFEEATSAQQSLKPLLAIA